MIKSLCSIARDATGDWDEQHIAEDLQGFHLSGQKSSWH